jgi:hypothetical protein
LARPPAYSISAAWGSTATSPIIRPFPRTATDVFARAISCASCSRPWWEAIDKALKADGPAIVDCVIAADELPNVPHLELETMENYAEAKIKEAILEVTGG